EPLARELVRGYAASLGTIDLVAECASGDELGDVLPRAKPDVALLDVRMPGTDVFVVLASQPPGSLPAVIFATAFDTYAGRAFELNAVDYLGKPYSAERFGEAIRRVRDRRTDGLEHLIRDLGPRPDRLLVPDGRRMTPVAIVAISWIKAEGDYARIHAG